MTFEPGSLRVIFMMGHNNGSVQITGINVEMPDVGLPPVGEQLNTNSHFKRDNYSWGMPNRKLTPWAFSNLATHRILKINVKKGNPKKVWATSLSQAIACSLPKATRVKLKVRARSQTPGAIFDIYLEGKGRQKERLIKLPNQKIEQDWLWFTGEAIMPKSYKLREVRIVLYLGHKEQEIEFDKIELLRIADAP